MPALLGPLLSEDAAVDVAAELVASLPAVTTTVCPPTVTTDGFPVEVADAVEDLTVSEAAAGAFSTSAAIPVT